ncbi:unnamed protein product [Urochloa decumbens]|uniref:DUF569 domain-containing protein n=1 Tax=Urochloa decumbens TaxID=240449 RepID=A0ABC9DWV0_9POAL
MELFPDGAHVRLRSRVHGTYLHADSDGVGASTSPRRASLSAAWAAHRLVRGGAAYVLLRSAAYGRYLALWSPPAPRGQVGGGGRPILRAYDDPEQDDVLWVAVRAAGDEDEDEGDDGVLLRHGRDGTSFVGVSGDSDDNRRSHWVVEAIPPRQRPPFLPAPVPLCVRGGSQGRLTPLVIDLPANEEAMDIVVLTAWSPVSEFKRTNVRANGRTSTAMAWWPRRTRTCQLEGSAPPACAQLALSNRPETAASLKYPAPPSPSKSNGNRRNQQHLLCLCSSLPHRFPLAGAIERTYSPATARLRSKSASAAAMELFPDRAHLRLQSIVRGTYLNADEDGRGVSLTGRRESLNTAWQVHRVTGVDGTHRVLLHSAAYGRYLAISTRAAPYGHRGLRAIQTTYGAPQQADIVWEPVAVGDHIVVMRHPSNRLLRANGRYRL